MRLIYVLLCVSFSFTAFSQETKKIALVIGNSNYDNPDAFLHNPLKDCKLMEDAFIELEFDSIIVANDLTLDSMERIFRCINH